MSRHTWLVLLLLPIALSVARATAAGPADEEPPSPQSANAATPKDILPPIEPDRPDVTNGTHLVDIGLMQVEAGVQHSRLGTQRNLGTPVTVRIGLTEWLEARVSTDGFLRQSDESSSVSGAGNVQVGTKIGLFAEAGGTPVLSILPTVNFPVASASKGLGSGDVDVTLVALTGTDLGKTSHIDFNYGFGSIGAGEGRPHFAQHLVSVSFSHSLTERFEPYVEGFWFSRQDPDGGGIFALDAGFIHTLGARVAVDGGVAVGLTNAAPDVSVFAGISVMVGDILGEYGARARRRRAARLQGRAQR